MTDPTDDPHPDSSISEERQSGESPGQRVELGPAQILAAAAKDRKPGVAVAMGCALIVVLCCFGGVAGATGWGVLRYTALGDARDKVAAPDGWDVVDESAWPWAAYATLTGPADADAVADWVGRTGAETTVDKVEKCLTERPCTALGRVGGFDVTIEYGPDGAGRATATVTVD